MKYELPNKTSGYFPEALATLNSLPPEFTKKELRLFHPADVFLFSFMDAIKCAKKLSEMLNIETEKRQKNTAYEPKNLEEFEKEIFNLFFYSANFIEACQSIIKCLIDDKKLTKASRRFNGMIIKYKSHTSTIINEIKHKHRRVRTFSSLWDENLIIGYYVEGLIAENVMGPDPLIHKDHNGVRTGKSLNLEIPYQIINIYFTSACLDSVIKEHLPITNEILNINEPKEVSDCLTEAAKIPTLLLPNEFKGKIPSIKKKTNDGFSLANPGHKNPENKKPHNMSISLSSRIGIKCKTLALPYFIGST